MSGKWYDKDMNKMSRSWTIYSVGLFVVWAILFLVIWLAHGTAMLQELSLVFAGYVLGWLSATIKHFLLTSK